MNKDVATFGRFIGAAGIDPLENALTRKLGLLFEIPMLMAAFWVLLNWWAQSQEGGSDKSLQFYDLLLWALFVIETSTLSLVANDPVRYIKSNWLNLVIIAVGLPLLMGLDVHLGILRLLRLVILLALLLHVGGRVRKMLSRNQLGTTLLASLIVIVMAGVMMAAIDPAIHSPMEGIWWAWVTVTTVGYGDVVPVTTLGRILASVIILMGIGLFSMITASFAAFFISQKEEAILDEEQDMYRRIDEMEDRLIRLEEKIDALLARESGK